MGVTILKEKLKQIILENEKEMIDFRRDLHKHPELSWEEVRTTNVIAAVLDKHNIKYRRTEPTGIIGEIKGEKPGKTVLLRADIDALAIEELNDLDYKSEYEGKMHACGHDSHPAMLMYSLIALNEVKSSLKGTVRFVFQPCEEFTEGAMEMIKQGVMEGVDDVFGIHVWSLLPSGKIACNYGPSFASNDVIKVKFKGRGAHAASPHLSIDTAIVASSFVENVQAVVSREADPLQPVVITIGRMDVGTRYNIIAENAVLDGTVRTLDEDFRKVVEERVRHYAKSVAGMYGAESEVSFFKGTNVLSNDKNSAAFARRIITDTFGEDSLVDIKPTMGGEDFCHYLTSTPGCFVFLGSGNPEKKTNNPHHNGCFNVDEDVMKSGAILYAYYAYDYLNKN
jgi:amidohydrolase